MPRQYLICLTWGPQDGHTILTSNLHLCPFSVPTFREGYRAVYQAGDLLDDSREGPIRVRCAFVGWERVGAQVRIAE